MQSFAEREAGAGMASGGFASSQPLELPRLTQADALHLVLIALQARTVGATSACRAADNESFAIRSGTS